MLNCTLFIFVLFCYVLVRLWVLFVCFLSISCLFLNSHVRNESFIHSFKLLWISVPFVWGWSGPDTGWTAVRGADASVISSDGSPCSPPRLQRAAEPAAPNKVKQKKSEHASQGKEEHGVIHYCSSSVSSNGTDSLFPVSSWECGRRSAGEKVLRGHVDAEQWVNVALRRSSFSSYVVAAEVNGP